MQLSEEQKDDHTCDEIFSLYLQDVSKRVNDHYYRVCLRFILLFRDCLNEFGWFKRRDHFQKAEMLDQDEILKKLRFDEEAAEPKEESKEESKEEMKEQDDEIYIPQAEYTAVCNADFAPLVCNEFVSEFLFREHGACRLDRGDAIDLTRNFCNWIFVNKLTCARIQLTGAL